MKNIYVNIIAPLLLAFLLFGLSGCTKEAPDEQTETKVGVIFNLTDAVLRNGVLFNGDAKITKLRIMVFRGAALDVQKVFEGPTLNIQVQLETTVGTGRRIVAIANEPDAMSSSLDNILFYHRLKNEMLPKIGASQEIPLVMIGEKTGVDINEHPTSQVEVSLNRVVAKITLNIKQDTANDDVVQIKSVNIIRNAGESFLMPLDKPVNKTHLWDWELNNIDKLLVNHGVATSIIEDNTLYVYENLASAVADTAGRAPVLYVKTLYNGIESVYKSYINANAGERQYQIVRNHHYKLDATISKIGEYDGMLLTTQILPWNKEELTYKFLKPYLVNIEPEGFANQEHQVTYTHPIEFKVRIKALEGDIWKATLSDGLHFKFEGAVEGLADGTTQYTIKVLAKGEGGSKARHAHVYFTVNGKFVILGEGSDQYARINIVQPVG